MTYENILRLLSQFDDAQGNLAAQCWYDIENKVEEFIVKESSASEEEKELFLLELFSKPRNGFLEIKQNAQNRIEFSILSSKIATRLITKVSIQKKEAWLEIIENQIFKYPNADIVNFYYPYWLEPLLTEEECLALMTRLLDQTSTGTAPVFAVHPHYITSYYKKSKLKKAIESAIENGDCDVAFANIHLAQYYLNDVSLKDKETLDYVQEQVCYMVEALMSSDDLSEKQKANGFISMACQWDDCMFEKIPAKRTIQILKNFDDDFVPYAIQSLMLGLKGVEVSLSEYMELTELVETKSKDLNTNYPHILHELLADSTEKANYWNLKLEDILQLIA